MSSIDFEERTTKARIRDAAIECIARDGLAGTTVRGIAKEADVSAGSVIHHYGSMDGLRQACDEYVLAEIRRIKTEAAERGVTYDPIESFKQQTNGLPVTRYLAEVVTESSPAVDTLVDEMVADAVVHTEQMVEAGLMKPSADPRGRAVILVSMSLGNLMMRRHLKRLLGVDVTVPPTNPTDAAPYMGPMLELFHQGLSTDVAFEAMREAFVAAAEGEVTDKESKAS
jgi:AcrR family transcriptional regulator